VFLTEDWMLELVTNAKSILDAGCGTGAAWWSNKRPETHMIAVDLLDTPTNLPPNTSFFFSDIESFCERKDYAGSFDLILAEHVMEHFSDPARVALLFNRVLAVNGIVHIGIPDASMFSDRFFRLIHPEGGGHISQLTLQSLTEIMSAAGFKLITHRPWAENWQWLKRNYKWKDRGIQFITQPEIDYIADVFLKELTAEKGYFYGWECVFVKSDEPGNQPKLPSCPPVVEQSYNVPPLSAETSFPFTQTELSELRWIAHRVSLLKQKPIYRWIKKMIK
jgi:SAM-dependent methyltransferase